MSKNIKYTVRRHLQKGKEYGFFQIRGHVTDAKQGEVIELINPEKFNIAFINCKLYSKEKQAEKIFKGLTTKKPCAWIIFESYIITPKEEIKEVINLEFNPRKNPFWVLDGKNVDNKLINKIVMNNSKLFI